MTEKDREKKLHTEAQEKAIPQVHTKSTKRKKMQEKKSLHIIKSTRRMANTSGPDKLPATLPLKDQKLL